MMGKGVPSPLGIFQELQDIIDFAVEARERLIEKEEKKDDG